MSRKPISPYGAKTHITLRISPDIKAMLKACDLPASVVVELGVRDWVKGNHPKIYNAVTDELLNELWETKHGGNT